MKENAIRNYGGVAFIKSKHNHSEYRNDVIRDMCRRCFVDGFVDGVKFYANHLYDKGSIFDIVDSIRRTSECDEWSPLVDFEKTILKVLDKKIRNYDENYEIREELRKLINISKTEIARRDQTIENQQKEIEELNKWLVFLKK